MSTPFVRYLLSAAPAPDGRRQKPTSNGPRNKHLPKNKALIGNPDLAVLKAENQNPTHVTPRIAALAQGLVREELVVVGPPPPARNKDLLNIEKKKAYDHLCRLIAKAKKEIKDIDYQKKDRVSVHSEFYKAVEVEKEIYRVYFLIYILFLVFISFGTDWRLRPHSKRHQGPLGGS
jgi:DNA (cytosine-5)-methyltransferase 1